MSTTDTELLLNVAKAADGLIRASHCYCDDDDEEAPSCWHCKTWAALRFLREAGVDLTRSEEG